MSSSVISVENLSKYYKLGLIGGGTLREDVSRWTAKLRGKPDPTIPVGTQDHHNRKGGEIWALRDINLEVKEGEILGIIGRNGAGKSTLLKILSRITAPTSGRAVIRGRVGSLLEVGTGFHPELTGRDNIYLNGAILGMTKAEVTRKLEEIVEFAEMGQFIDTPVKRYSSGMTVRLAFAVAAHLEPEILIVDEVLAVGDVAFQKKCLGKMGEVPKHGRTVLFVSHNMASIESLCTTAVLLRLGEFCLKGSASEVVDYYLENIENTSQNYLGIYSTKLKEHQEHKEHPILLENIEVLDNDDLRASEFGINDNIKIVISYYARKTIGSCAFGVSITNTIGIEMVRLSTWPISGFEMLNIEGRGAAELKINRVNLASGEYYITVYCSRPNIEEIWRIINVAKVRIRATDVYKSGFPVESWFGIVALDHEWKLTRHT